MAWQTRIIELHFETSCSSFCYFRFKKIFIISHFSMLMSMRKTYFQSGILISYIVHCFTCLFFSKWDCFFLLWKQSQLLLFCWMRTRRRWHNYVFWGHTWCVWALLKCCFLPHTHPPIFVYWPFLKDAYPFWRLKLILTGKLKS